MKRSTLLIFCLLASTSSVFGASSDERSNLTRTSSASSHYTESELGYYAQQAGVGSEYERMRHGETELAKDPVVNSRMQDAIWQWEQWQQSHPPTPDQAAAHS